MTASSAARPMTTNEPELLLRRYQDVRAQSLAWCQPLEVDDYQIQSIAETSPPKWHLAHVTWFFERFVLGHFRSDYKPFHPRYDYLFNSYYQTVGAMQPRPRRGLLSRPTVAEVLAYRQAVDEQMAELLQNPALADQPELAQRVVLGLNHEQQHQELLLMDIKHNFWVNPLRPVYQPRQPVQRSASSEPMGWVEKGGGQLTIGSDGDPFCFDNETPQQEHRLRPHALGDRLITCAEYLAFMNDEGYQRPDLWLADGWAWLQQHGVNCPLYWEQTDGDWQVFTLAGMQPLQAAEPVAHISFYEADAYARWAGVRLADEFELEATLQREPKQGNFVDDRHLHPYPGQGQWYGDLWEWTASAYQAYPGFKPLAGSLGEYNGKFMCNQMSLRGGSCVTPQEHMRPSYRNFFYPHDRWAFTGLRLAKDLA